MESEIPEPPSAAENGAGGGEKGVEGAESANWAENDPSCGAAVETGGSPANQVERDVGGGGHAPAESAPSSGRPATADSDHNGRSTASAAVLLDGSASGGEPPVDPAGVPLTDKSSVLASPHAPGSAGASLQLVAAGACCTDTVFCGDRSWSSGATATGTAARLRRTGA